MYEILNIGTAAPVAVHFISQSFCIGAISAEPGA